MESWRSSAATQGRAQHCLPITADDPGTALARKAVTSSNVSANPRLQSPAPEILEYLARQPEAQDTIDGIQWWVLDSCIRNWAPKIRETVAKLVEQGLLEEKLSPDGQSFYRVSPHYLSSLRQAQPRNCIPDATPKH